MIKPSFNDDVDLDGNPVANPMRKTAQGQEELARRLSNEAILGRVVTVEVHENESINVFIHPPEGCTGQTMTINVKASTLANIIRKRARIEAQRPDDFQHVVQVGEGAVDTGPEIVVCTEDELLGR